MSPRLLVRQIKSNHKESFDFDFDNNKVIVDLYTSGVKSLRFDSLFETTNDKNWADRCEFSPCGNYINANNGDNFNLHVSTMYEGHKIAKRGADGQWNNTSIISINGFLGHGGLPSYKY